MIQLVVSLITHRELSEKMEKSGAEVIDSGVSCMDELREASIGMLVTSVMLVYEVGAKSLNASDLVR
jgi:hypothetical protein